jgi:hypothetical protein
VLSSLDGPRIERRTAQSRRSSHPTGPRLLPSHGTPHPHAPSDPTPSQIAAQLLAGTPYTTRAAALLVSEGRSGSSLTGEVAFDAHPDFVYTYEPCRAPPALWEAECTSARPLALEPLAAAHTAILLLCCSAALLLALRHSPPSCAVASKRVWLWRACKLCAYRAGPSREPARWDPACVPTGALHCACSPAPSLRMSSCVLPATVHSDGSHSACIPTPSSALFLPTRAALRVLLLPHMAGAFRRYSRVARSIVPAHAAQLLAADSNGTQSARWYQQWMAVCWSSHRAVKLIRAPHFGGLDVSNGGDGAVSSSNHALSPPRLHVLQLVRHPMHVVSSRLRLRTCSADQTHKYCSCCLDIAAMAVAC